MPRTIVIIGAGFAGVWSALSAKRLANLTNKGEIINIVVIAPEPYLVIRPRLYESNASSMKHPLMDLFDFAGVQFLQGTAETIDTEAHIVHVRSPTGHKSDVSFDRLILAAGSSVVRPQSVIGLQQHAFDIDTLESAVKLETHLEGLASHQSSAARNTVVVCGAGFTGIELATELPKRLKHLTSPRVILIEGAHQLGPELGQGPRPVITEALEDLGIEVKLGSAVASIDSYSVTLLSGERIETFTSIWTAGMRATPLTNQIPGARDKLSHILVDRHLRSLSCEHVFVTGDAAYATADDQGHHALMSCQHALQLGRISGHNAAADLINEPLLEYSQAAYNCCLDLGSWGAVVTGGWDREIKIQGDLAKRAKGYVNQKLIYPPSDAQEALQAASPAGPDSDELFKHILAVGLMVQYTEHEINLALEAIGNDQSVKKAAYKYGIPRTTLQLRLYGSQRRAAAFADLQRLSVSQEAKLASWVQIQADLGLAPTHQYNIDKNVILKGKGSNGLVLGRAKTKSVRKKQPGSRAWVSIIECISAKGIPLYPLVIYKGKTVQQQWFPLDLSPYDG
ncbi:pyridine nucleotide-disulfide oxidoreductase family protein [Colletotrichum incanum]|uniref:Pyridine nucleotide-disulfide oxidoreductase family protein n=1 Tax=Colletotrichum incanum TaxID=1573173 RepID=A0A167DI52_COLIC|nr:pyridine nucleotide-disulfide oxidoreductase family protein [Colletotrichum incanum]